MFFKKVIRKVDIYDGEKLPWGYGIAYQNYLQAFFVAYPIPLNLFVRGFRKLREYVILYSPGQLERDLADAHNKGFQEGLEVGEKRTKEALANSLDAYLKERTH